MKRRSVLSSAAVLAVAAGLLTAAPSQAAGVPLPSGCSTQSRPATTADVTDLRCKDLANNADLARYTTLTYLEIGSWEPGARPATLTALPKLPASLFSLNLVADKVTDMRSLSALRKLRSLYVSGSTVTDLASVANNSELTFLSLSGPGYWGADFSVLAKLSKLEILDISGFSPKKILANEGEWMAGGFSRGLDGKRILPQNSDHVDESGKPTGVKEYSYDAATDRFKYNSATKQSQTVRVSTPPKIKSMPKLANYNIWLGRSLDVAAQADWTSEKANSLVVSGTRKVGSTLAVRHKFPERNYADTYQWKRDGKAIPGATGKTYKLVASDRGRSISVTATDARSSSPFGAWFRYVPYSQTVKATSRL